MRTPNTISEAIENSSRPPAMRNAGKRNAERAEKPIADQRGADEDRAGDDAGAQRDAAARRVAAGRR